MGAGNSPTKLISSAGGSLGRIQLLPAFEAEDRSSKIKKLGELSPQSILIAKDQSGGQVDP